MWYTPPAHRFSYPQSVFCPPSVCIAAAALDLALPLVQGSAAPGLGTHPWGWGPIPGAPHPAVDAEGDPLLLRRSASAEGLLLCSLGMGTPTGGGGCSGLVGASAGSIPLWDLGRGRGGRFSDLGGDSAEGLPLWGGLDTGNSALGDGCIGMGGASAGCLLPWALGMGTPAGGGGCSGLVGASAEGGPGGVGQPQDNRQGLFRYSPSSSSVRAQGDAIGSCSSQELVAAFAFQRPASGVRAIGLVLSTGFSAMAFPTRSLIVPPSLPPSPDPCINLTPLSSCVRNVMMLTVLSSHLH